MKRISLIIAVFLFGASSGWAQSHEVKQLILNVEKLSQLKNILTDMKKGYTIVSNGYNTVKDIASGNFSLHEVFLDGLMIVSPEVKKYRKVADIITYQKSIVKEYKSALKAFKASDVFANGELEYLSSVYNNLFDASIQNIEDLTIVITSSKLRMNDEERLKAIDRIFLDVSDKLEFLRSFNREAVMLAKQKERQKQEILHLRSIYGQN